MNGKPLIINF
jgi:hypothetical protein